MRPALPATALIIALDATPLTVSTGGVVRYTLELTRALGAAFPTDRYWLLSDQIVPAELSFPSNVQIGSPPLTRAARKWWIYGVDREMSRRGVELFHGTDFSVPYIPRRPSVMTLHDLSPWKLAECQPDAGRVRRRTPVLLRLGLATMVITPSEAVRREAVAYFGLQSDRVVAIPLSASPAFRRVDVPRSGKPYFLFVGTLEPRKNLARLLEAWRETRKSLDVDLVLAGRIREDFAAPPAEPGLHVLGAVPEAELPALYSGALACLYPSLYEGFGLPVLEAMRCGALVVTSRDPALTELSAESAIHVEATDTRALAEALSAVARAPQTFDALRARGLARSAEFSWEKTARLTREVYDAALRVFRR